MDDLGGTPISGNPHFRNGPLRANWIFWTLAQHCGAPGDSFGPSHCLGTFKLFVVLKNDVVQWWDNVEVHGTCFKHILFCDLKSDAVHDATRADEVSNIIQGGQLRILMVSHSTDAHG